jgi:2-amino-4-hydroxy-6-hydroxymethyldihydropteridine diphosphokinase
MEEGSQFIAKTPALAIALGANLPSPAGPPQATLQAVRPLLQGVLRRRVALPGTVLCWSPLYCTAPVGGPPSQPDYLNAVVLVRPTITPSAAAGRELLAALQALEARFARQRHERWGPRSLDLDILWWGDLLSCSAELTLPHPRLLERSFVLAPLAAIDPALQPAGADAGAAALLARLQAVGAMPNPEQLAGCPGWPEPGWDGAGA